MIRTCGYNSQYTQFNSVYLNLGSERCFMHWTSMYLCTIRFFVSTGAHVRFPGLILRVKVLANCCRTQVRTLFMPLPASYCLMPK